MEQDVPTPGFADLTLTPRPVSPRRSSTKGKDMSPSRLASTTNESHLQEEAFDPASYAQHLDFQSVPTHSNAVVTSPRLAATTAQRGRARSCGSRASSAPSAYLQQCRQLGVRCQIQECIATS